MAMAKVVVALALMCMASAQENYDVVPETLVGELQDEPAGVSITKECFEKTCGPDGCSMAKMECTPHAKNAPWLVFVSADQKQRLVSAKTMEEHAPGLVKVIAHHHTLNPNQAIAMPGVPAKAPKTFLDAMAKQDTLVKKITEMEKKQLKMDPMNKKARSNWLKLADQIKHMPISPDKLKSQQLLLKLAKQLADKEQMERAKGITQTGSDSSNAPSPEEVKKAMLKKLIKEVVKEHARKVNDAAPVASKEAVAKEILPFLKKIMDKMGGMKPTPEAKQHKTIDGLPVSHRKCVMRACIKKDADGGCGAAVISCGAADGSEPPASMHKKLKKKAALALAKHSMGALAPLIKAVNQQKADPSMMVEEMLDEQEMFH